MEEQNLQLSHVLYRVTDLHLAVKKLEEAGFIVEYGTQKEKAYNALIWFNEGVFIEIYQHSGLSAPVKLFMKLFGFKRILDRLEKWESVENGWCEWSLESRNNDLEAEKKLFKRNKIAFKSHKANRIDKNKVKLRWELLMPNDIIFPFIMSAYNPSPRPLDIKHPNGITGVKSITVGRVGLDEKLLKQLLENKRGLNLVHNAVGLQKVELINTNLSIKDILN